MDFTKNGRATVGKIGKSGPFLESLEFAARTEVSGTLLFFEELETGSVF